MSRKFDDASWHYGGDFPKGLPDEAGATHIGMFVSWAIRKGLAGAIHKEDFPNMLKKLETREMTPGAWFVVACDEKFTCEDLNGEGNSFAEVYYCDGEGLNTNSPGYLSDYATTFPECGDLYSVPDTWASFDRLTPVLDRRFAEWQSPKPKGWRRLFG